MNGCETLGNLWDHWNECGKNVPETHGIYKIILPAEMELRFVERIEGHPAADTYDVGALTDKYKQSGCSKLLYVGKAEGRRGLRQRIRQYLLYGVDRGNDHRGGRAIFQIESFSGGHYMFYTEKSGCPYSFLFAPTDISTFDGTTESGDRICGVFSNQDNAVIFNNAKVGMEHREFEAEIGKIYTAAMDNEAEYDCPSATFSVEATSFLDGKRHEYTLVILENDGYVCNAAIYE